MKRVTIYTHPRATIQNVELLGQIQELGVDIQQVSDAGYQACFEFDFEMNDELEQDFDLSTKVGEMLDELILF